MKDSTRVFVIFLAFLLLSVAGLYSFQVGNMSLVAFSLFELCFCIPIMTSLGALASAWEDMGE